MNNPLPLICVSQASWDGNYLKSTVELMKEMALFRTVLFVDYTYTFKDVFTLGSKKKFPLNNILTQKLRKPFADKELYILNPPPVFPINWINRPKVYNWAMKINGFIVKLAIKRARKKIKISESEWLVAMAPALGIQMKSHWKQEDFWYYSYDQISAAKYIGKHGADQEKQFLKMAKGVVCSSAALKEDKEIYNSNCHVVPNGVNIKNFLSVTRIKTVRPIIGYVGTIDDRLDLTLLISVIQELPQVQFSFVGRVTGQKVKENLVKLTNVVFHQPVDSDRLPYIMQKFSLGIIPFVSNEFTKYIYPLKINEYLAMGLPIVSTPFADLSDFDSIISKGSDTDTFIQAIIKELRDDEPFLYSERKKVAEGNSWYHRSILLNKILALKINDQILLNTEA